MAPWFVVLLAVLAVSPAVRLQQEVKQEEKAEDKKAEAAKTETSKTNASASQTATDPKDDTCQLAAGKTAPPHPWCGLLQTLR